MARAPNLVPTQTQEKTLKEHDDEAEDVARFFMYAPQLSINRLRGILLEEGIELMIGPAQQTSFIQFPDPLQDVSR